MVAFFVRLRFSSYRLSHTIFTLDWTLFILKTGTSRNKGHTLLKRIKRIQSSNEHCRAKLKLLSQGKLSSKNNLASCLKTSDYAV